MSFLGTGPHRVCTYTHAHVCAHTFLPAQSQNHSTVLSCPATPTNWLSDSASPPLFPATTPVLPMADAFITSTSQRSPVREHCDPPIEQNGEAKGTQRALVPKEMHLKSIQNHGVQQKSRRSINGSRVGGVFKFMLFHSKDRMFHKMSGLNKLNKFKSTNI